MTKKHGFIFDMDNTLLHSKIDFNLMKNEVAKFMKQRDVLCLDWEDKITSQIIEWGEKQPSFTAKDVADVWQLVADVETMGMLEAELEPGALELLQALKKQNKSYITILTNNAQEAAEKALERCNVTEYFDLIVGRGVIKNLKPYPDGFLYILEQYPQLKSSDWLAVGDAWIDAVAADKAKIPFAAYNRSRAEDWQEHSSKCIKFLTGWQQENREKLLNFFD